MFQIAHIGIKVRSLEVSVQFYKNILEFKLCGIHENERVKIAFMEGDNCVIELLEYSADKTEREAGVVDHIAFIVNNLEEEINKLKAQNVDLIFDQSRPFMKGKIFFFKGPDGERLEFIQKC